jgi:HAE1 family hydrophobic/amphiphilic exporter-1
MWPSASPEEIEQELLIPIETALRNISGLSNIETIAGSGFGLTNIYFHAGVDMDEAYVEVVNRINQVQIQPEDAASPVIRNRGRGRAEFAIATLFLAPLEGGRPVSDREFEAAFRQVVWPALTQISGIAAIDGQQNQLEPQIHIRINAHKLVPLGITLNDIRTAVGGLRNSTVGTSNVGDTPFTLISDSRLPIEEFGSVAIGSQNNRTVFLGDVASISRGFGPRTRHYYFNGRSAFYVVIEALDGADDLAVLDGIKEEIAYLNSGPLRPRGLELHLSRDSSVRIKQAIWFVQGSVILGIIFAIAALLVFVRRPVAIALIFVTLPVSLAFACIVLYVSGRTLNVVSIAGLAISTGLVLDAAIVVVERISKLRTREEALSLSILQAFHETGPALIVATITSVVVFLPIFLMDSTEGMLFTDLALVVSATVIASLLTCFLVLPPLANRHWKVTSTELSTPPMHKFLSVVVDYYIKASERKFVALMIVVVGLALPIVMATFLLPDRDLLPKVDDTSTATVFRLSEPITHHATLDLIIKPITNKLEPYLSGAKSPKIAKYLITSPDPQTLILGVYPDNDSDLDDVYSLVSGNLFADIEIANANSEVVSMLRFAITTDDGVIIDIKGSDISALRASASSALGRVSEAFPDSPVFPMVPLSDAAPTIRFYPRTQALANANLDRTDLDAWLSMLSTGLYSGEYFDGSQRYDIFLKSHEDLDVNEIKNTQVVTPTGTTPLSSLTEAKIGLAPRILYRSDFAKTLPILAMPPDGVALSSFSDQVEDLLDIESEAGTSDNTYFTFRGDANKLAVLEAQLVENFVLAMLVLGLVVTSLFRSLKDGAIIVTSLGIALSGGILALWIAAVTLGQTFDVLSMMAFIILVGLVINNSILFLQRFNFHLEADCSREDAITLALHDRVRPIFMSTITSIFGMLPLLLSPGVGSELYRGLAAIIVGGMAFSLGGSIMFIVAAIRLTTPQDNHGVGLASVADVDGRARTYLP